MESGKWFFGGNEGEMQGVFRKINFLTDLVRSQ